MKKVYEIATDGMIYGFLEPYMKLPYIECFTTGEPRVQFVFRIPYSRDVWAGLKDKAVKHAWIIFGTAVLAKCWIEDKQYWLVDRGEIPERGYADWYAIEINRGGVWK
jgi:hypothetical protein